MIKGKVIKGRVQAVGSGTWYGCGHCYDYVTFLEEGGNIIRVSKVTVPPLIGDVFKVGKEAEFYFHAFKKNSTLLAMKNGEQKIYSHDDAKTVFKFYTDKKRLTQFFFVVSVICIFAFLMQRMPLASGLTLLITLYLAPFLYIYRKNAHYLRPEQADQLIRDLGFN